MKKTIKKLMAALLAVALLCAMAVPAFAAEDATPTTTSTTGTVTVQNVVSGKTYKIYRILDIDTHDSTYSSVVYKVNNNWKAFIKSTGKAYFTSIDDTTGVVVVKKDLTSEDIANLAAAAKAWLGEHDIADDGEKTAGATDTSIQFTGKELGYYLLSSSNWGTNNADAIFSLSSSNPNVTVQEKNGKPIIDKKIIENNNPVDSNTAGIGDYVQFKTTVTVVDGTPYAYKITDTMSAGLTFINNNTSYPLTVTVNNATFDASNYTLTSTTNGFTLTFHDNDDTSVLHTNDVVVVTYYAQVNNNAVVGSSGNTNTATLNYGHTPTNGGSSTTTTYVWDFSIHKYTTTTTDSDIALSGAVFKLYKTNGSTKSYATFGGASTNSDNVSVYKLTGWTDTEASATELSTPASGNIKLEGLDAGTYYLKEVTAPEGYNKLTADIEVIITGTMPSGESAVASHTVSYKAVGAEGNASTADEGTVRVLNNAGATLPSTGGMGTTLFYVIGGGLMVAAVVLLVTKKRMENK